MIGAIVSLLSEWAIVSIGRDIAAKMVRRVAETAVVMVILAVLGLASLAFLYLLLYIWISSRLNDLAAAGILCGANLAAIALIVGARAAATALRRRRASREAHSDLNAISQVALDLEERLREKAPTVALIAMIVGVVIGARPELLDLFRSSSRKAKRSDRSGR